MFCLSVYRSISFATFQRACFGQCSALFSHTHLTFHNTLAKPNHQNQCWWSTYLQNHKQVKTRHFAFVYVDVSISLLAQDSENKSLPVLAATKTAGRVCLKKKNGQFCCLKNVWRCFSFMCRPAWFSLHKNSWKSSRIVGLQSLVGRVVACNNTITIPSNSWCERRPKSIHYDVNAICHILYKYQPWMYLQFAVNCNIISGQLGCKRPLACGTCGSHMAYFLAPKGLKPHASTARVMWMKRTASLLDTLSL